VSAPRCAIWICPVRLHSIRADGHELSVSFAFLFVSFADLASIAVQRIRTSQYFCRRDGVDLREDGRTRSDWPPTSPAAEWVFPGTCGVSVSVLPAQLSCRRHPLHRFSFCLCAYKRALLLLRASTYDGENGSVVCSATECALGDGLLRGMAASKQSFTALNALDLSGLCGRRPRLRLFFFLV
jgi:hypothetical protein